MPGHMHAAIQSMRVRTAKLKSKGLYVNQSVVFIGQKPLIVVCMADEENDFLGKGANMFGPSGPWPRREAATK